MWSFSSSSSSSKRHGHSVSDSLLTVDLPANAPYFSHHSLKQSLKENIPLHAMFLAVGTLHMNVATHRSNSTRCCRQKDRNVLSCCNLTYLIDCIHSKLLFLELAATKVACMPKK